MHIFTETDPEGGIHLGFDYTKELCHVQSDFQDIKVIETTAYGRMLILDDCVMLTDYDEFVYHEMIAHIPCLYHKNPKSALVLGGGDGGTVRELLKHKSLEQIVLCEIDGKVVDVCKEFFPALTAGLSDKRVEVKIADGIDYVKNCKQKFDVVIVDSTDPMGPGEGLFSREFYGNVTKILNEGGVMAAQSETPWFSRPESFARIQKNISGGFSQQKTYVGPIPSYPRGFWSWTMASNDAHVFAKPHLERMQPFAEDLQFLTPKSVENIFDLPPFVRRKRQL